MFVTELPIYIPEAYADGLLGRRIVARIKDTGTYILFVPPYYDPEDPRVLRGTWVKDAAMAKYGFVPFHVTQP